MAESGIKKYDELPGRVGVIDVDMHRWALKRKIERESFGENFFTKTIDLLTVPSITKKKLIETLENARKEHLENNNKRGN